MEKNQEILEQKTKLLIRYSNELAQWALKHSSDEKIFASAVGAVSTIRDLEEIFEPKEKEPLKKWDPIKMF